jgi:hypothetical protein
LREALEEDEATTRGTSGEAEKYTINSGKKRAARLHSLSTASMKKSSGIITALCLVFLLALVSVGVGRVSKQPDAFVFLQSMEGIDDGAAVLWKGRKVGVISARSMSRGVHKLELTLEPTVFNTVHSDAEIRIDRSHGVLVLTGGDRRSEPFLEKGAEIALEKSTLSKKLRLARSAFEDSVDRLCGFWGGLRTPRKRNCTELEEIEIITKSLRQSDAHTQEPDVFVVGSLEGIEVGAPVEWNDARVGRVVKLGFQERRQRADILLDNGYRGRLHADARIQTEQSPSGKIRIIGGDDAREPILTRGDRIPVQSAGDEGRMAGASLKFFFHDFVDGLEDLWVSLRDKNFLREVEERDKYAAANSREVY